MIPKISILLKETFLDKTDWYLNFGSVGSIDKITLEVFLNSNLNIISDLFVESVLAGEYESDYAFEESLDLLTKDSSLVYDKLTMVQDTVLVNSTGNFIAGIKIFISIYKNFHKVLSIHKSSPNYDVLFTSSPNNSALYEGLNFTDEVVNGFVNFNRTVILNRLDHFFDEGITFFKTLIDLENKLNNSNHPFKHISALKLKISFLKYKWVIRQNTTYQNVGSQFSVKSYLHNNNLISVLDTPPLDSSKPELIEWQKYLEFHYEHSGKEYYLKKYNTLKSKENSEYTFFELHFMIKYHKDIKCDYKNLSDIVTEIESRESLFTEDKSIFFKNLNYALNNQFSLLVENPKATEPEVLLLRDKIKRLQIKANNDNFFLDYKYLNYKVSRLKTLIDGREAFDTNIPVKEHLREIRELISECEKKISWSQNHHNLLYQLPYNESLVKYNSESLENFYFASSFLLPLSVEQANNDIQKIKIEFSNEFNYTEVYNSLHREFNQIKSLKENVADYDKKSMETISIYTAIISFIVGGVSGFSFIDSFYKALIFLIIFSTSLISFLLLVFISTKGFQQIYKFKEVILSAYLGVAAILLVIFIFKDKSDDKEQLKKNQTLEKIIKKQVDSLSKVQNSDYEKVRKELEDIKNSKVKGSIIYLESK